MSSPRAPFCIHYTMTINTDTLLMAMQMTGNDPAPIKRALTLMDTFSKLQQGDPDPQLVLQLAGQLNPKVQPLVTLLNTVNSLEAARQAADQPNPSTAPGDQEPPGSPNKNMQDDVQYNHF